MAEQPTGPALDREVEYRVFGDDLSAFDAEGKERRERIADAIAEVTETIREPDFPIPGRWRLALGEVAWEFCAHGLKVWDNRHGTDYQHSLEAHVATYLAEPRPFSRDVRLAMGLLGTMRAWGVTSVDTHDGEYDGVMVSVKANHFPHFGEARYDEIDAKDDAERRELAFCAAICRAVLNAKGAER